MSQQEIVQLTRPQAQRQGAINCFVGDVGSGKTLRCVVEAIMAAQSGREVYMNFPLRPKFAEDYPELAARIHYVQDFYGFLQDREMEARQGRIYHEFEALFIVDEAQTVWNSRTSMSSQQIESTNYIFISRKIGLELHMATQLASNIEKRAKLLVQVWVVCTKLIYRGEYYFQFEFYHPEVGQVKTTYYTPGTAAQYYGYYETTTPTSIGPMSPIELSEEQQKESRPMTVKAFKVWRERSEHRQSEQLKALKKELREIGKSVNKIQKILKNKPKKNPLKTTQKGKGKARPKVNKGRGKRKGRR